MGRKLADRDKVSPEEAHRLLRIGEALVALDAVTWDDVYEALAELLGYRFVDLRETRVPAEAIEAVPSTWCPDRDHWGS